MGKNMYIEKFKMREQKIKNCLHGRDPAKNVNKENGHDQQKTGTVRAYSSMSQLYLQLYTKQVKIISSFAKF